MKSIISHIEINVLDYPAAIRFYDLVLIPMGFKRLNCMMEWTAYSDGQSKFIICPTDAEFKKEGYHRKRAGLNHLAFYANSREEVDDYYEKTLKQNGIKALYEENAFGDDDYYAVFFEGPDRLKLEYVYAPRYCQEDAWPNNLADEFDPYAIKE
ncbi:hypothetical protein A9Q84_10860 [Halobacteriovorax marinus]|uniref:VOC domain-containing protein n=1 Tax=Halobacteriovorax marinus TaxID=97084 RepID=A0A1Y5FD95_9BACT|nr:hypothetical protein A9Q84_10860 [Halobacteriovorax marinus]